MACATESASFVVEGRNPRELPSDVLGIVSAYSKPLMRHSQAYKEAMFALGITELFEVKKMLYTDKADKAIEYLTGYATATVAVKEAEQAEWGINVFTFPDIEKRWAEQLRINDLILSNIRLKNRFHRKMGLLMAGVEEEEADVEEEEDDFEDLRVADDIDYNSELDEF